MSEQLDVLKLVAERLQRADIAYMISGSIALNYYAQPRLTRDIDIVVALRREDAERVTNLFAEDFYIDADAVLKSGSTRKCDSPATIASDPPDTLPGASYRRSCRCQADRAIYK